MAEPVHGSSVSVNDPAVDHHADSDYPCFGTGGNATLPENVGLIQGSSGEIPHTAYRKVAKSWRCGSYDGRHRGGDES
jgi:hypothetical protein